MSVVDSSIFSAVPATQFSGIIPQWVTLSVRGIRNGWRVLMYDGLYYEGSEEHEREAQRKITGTLQEWQERRILRPLPSHLTDRIPMEIIDHIINQVACVEWIHDRQDARATLGACSQVCRAWYSQSCAHLYHSMALNGEAFDRLVKALKSGDASMKEQLLRTRELHIHASAAKPYLHALPYGLSRHAPNLIRLNIYCAPDHPELKLGRDFFILLPVVGARVTNLKLHELQWNNFGDFRRFINSFPRLEELQLSHNFSGLIKDSFDPTSQRQTAKYRQLRVLHIEGDGFARDLVWMKMILRWLTKYPPDLRELKIETESEPDAATLSLHSELLQALGNKLEVWQTRPSAFIKGWDPEATSTQSRIRKRTPSDEPAKEAFRQKQADYTSQIQ
ncbi:hypothetical protein WOLCODRAFT_164773 [Wolfiporia cocos MD-104 SS10]|uniref:F-box domain-containing protein n=1 Tax=Wolfiporia cocos (strain MD-104) TaxID=742152 RepID=A0A2H3JV48_WOLCO|nr:hypothetical protein WOLCODRAFT_164773 [Wolfiporia cocos MD-104 SS10]